MDDNLSFIGIAIDRSFDFIQRRPVLLVPILLPIYTVILICLLMNSQFQYSKPIRETVEIEQVLLNYIELDGEIRTLVVRCPKHNLRMTVYNKRLWETTKVGGILDVSYEEVREQSSGKLVGYIHIIGSERIGQVCSDKK